MKHWIKVQADSNTYKIEFDGKWEGPTCVEAQEETEKESGWIVRRWTVHQAWGGISKKVEKFYGNVTIVRVK